MWWRNAILIPSTFSSGYIIVMGHKKAYLVLTFVEICFIAIAA
jgi:hypothetical protein